MNVISIWSRERWQFTPLTGQCFQKKLGHGLLRARGAHQLLIEFKFNADVIARGVTGAQIIDEAIAGSPVRAVAMNGPLCVVLKLFLPLQNERRFARPGRVRKKANLGAPASPMKDRGEAVNAHVHQKPAARSCLSQSALDLGLDPAPVRTVMVGQNFFVDFASQRTRPN